MHRAYGRVVVILPSPVRERKKRETWRQVQATALRLMTERGFDAVSIDDIVVAAGVSRRTTQVGTYSCFRFVQPPRLQESSGVVKWRLLGRNCARLLGM